jgi:hypothetical protein
MEIQANAQRIADALVDPDLAAAVTVAPTPMGFKRRL